MVRPTKHETFIAMAYSLAKQATCARRQVACILTDKHHRIIGSGYNGNAKRLPHCIDTPCAGATLTSGYGLDACEAVHAEQNALMQCTDVDKIVSCYVTTSPCMHCLKMLLNTNCQNIYFFNPYTGHEACKNLWESANRNWIKIS